MFTKEGSREPFFTSFPDLKTTVSSKTIPGFSLLIYTGLPKQLKPSLRTKNKRKRTKRRNKKKNERNSIVKTLGALRKRKTREIAAKK